MPIEIKELVIKAEVVDNESNNKDVNNQSDSISNDIISNKRQIIEECVEQILSILEQKKDR